MLHRLYTGGQEFGSSSLNTLQCCTPNVLHTQIQDTAFAAAFVGTQVFPHGPADPVSGEFMAEE